MDGYPQIKTTRKDGGELFHQDGHSLNMRLLDFWRWSASDLVSNAMRGILAEYLVASALNLGQGVRAQWEAFDLITVSGIRIEVKSAAYLQSWHHKSLSTISFSIRPTRQWDAGTNAFAEELRRQADLYVFCVLQHKDKSTLDPMNVAQWDFYVLPSRVLNEYYPAQKTIRLSSLLRLKPLRAVYEELASAVEALGAEVKNT